MATASTPSAAPDPSIEPAAPPTRPIDPPAGPVDPPVPPVYPPVGPRPPEPSAPVGWVIAAMLLFWPTGIPALLASHRAARAFGAADLVTAQRESANARRWGIISVCVGAALVVLSVLLSLVWAVLAAVAFHESFDNGGWDRGPGMTHQMPFGDSGSSDDSGDSGRSMMPGRPGSGS